MNTIDTHGGAAVQAALTRQNIGIAVLGKANDVANQQAQAALALIESVAETGAAIDGGPSDGNRLDVTA
ncbi:MAG: hypothetical protein HOP29_03805 [Phycisphaerales bacterium]|nr:hypothetical protein [Phycisphaerales bacterium]